MLTPDSSRFWPLEGYKKGQGQPSYDKQFVRNWLLANPDSDYLLPIIRNKEVNEHCIYRNTGYNINHNLKSIAGMVGVNIPLTLYVARHSWASIAKAKGISDLRNLRGHGPRQRSHHTHLPCQPRQLRGRQSKLANSQVHQLKPFSNLSASGL